MQHVGTQLPVPPDLVYPFVKEWYNMLLQHVHFWKWREGAARFQASHKWGSPSLNTEARFSLLFLADVASREMYAQQLHNDVLQVCVWVAMYVM